MAFPGCEDTDIQKQSGTEPSEAFAAAVATNTKLLLGLWGSSGDQTITSEIAAINAAIKQFGSKFTSLVVGISVGSEDLYRTSDIGIKNKAGVGADPTSIANYIKQTKQAFAGTALSSVPVGHVDTWTAWYNTSNQAVIDASDFIGVDAYPYFENTVTNSIENSRGLFDTAIANVKSTVGGKEIWVTETGFPVAGPVSNLATPSTTDAKSYWDAVGCGELFNVTNTFWYTLEDNYGGSLSTSGPVFGVLDANGSPNFDLSCKGVSSNPSSSASVSGTASATNIGDGSPGVSAIPSGVASASASASASGASTTGASTSAGSGSGAGVGGSGSSGSGSSSSGVSTTASPSFTSTLVTNSAGQTITSSIIVNGTGSGGSTGIPISPTSSISPSQGAASHGAAPVTGLFGALLAALALL